MPRSEARAAGPSSRTAGPARPTLATKEEVIVVIVASAPGIYLGWGSYSIQLGNLIVIVTMVVMFALALLLPFPKPRRRR